MSRPSKISSTYSRMSYPAPTGYGTNLACDTSLQRNNDAFLFQLNDGSATTESTLVSPAAITPPGPNGNVSLAMTTTTPGDSTLTMQGQDTIINMTNQGGVNQINMNGQNTAINLTSNADATLGLVGGGAGATAPSSSTILLGSVAALGVNDILFGNPTTTGIALYQSTAVQGNCRSEITLHPPTLLRSTRPRTTSLWAACYQLEQSI